MFSSKPPNFTLTHNETKRGERGETRDLQGEHSFVERHRFDRLAGEKQNDSRKRSEGWMPYRCTRLIPIACDRHTAAIEQYCCLYLPPLTVPRTPRLCYHQLAFHDTNQQAKGHANDTIPSLFDHCCLAACTLCLTDHFLFVWAGMPNIQTMQF